MTTWGRCGVVEGADRWWRGPGGLVICIEGVRVTTSEMAAALP